MLIKTIAHFIIANPYFSIAYLFLLPAIIYRITHEVMTTKSLEGKHGKYQGLNMATLVDETECNLYRTKAIYWFCITLLFLFFAAPVLFATAINIVNPAVIYLPWYTEMIDTFAIIIAGLSIMFIKKQLPYRV